MADGGFLGYKVVRVVGGRRVSAIAGSLHDPFNRSQYLASRYRGTRRAYVPEQWTDAMPKDELLTAFATYAQALAFAAYQCCQVRRCVVDFEVWQCYCHSCDPPAWVEHASAQPRGTIFAPTICITDSLAPPVRIRAVPRRRWPL